MARKILFATAAALCVLAGQAYADGSVTQTWEQVTAQDAGGGWQDTDKYVLTFSWVGDATTGAVPDTQSAVNINGYVVQVTTDPGSPAPTDNYDITLVDVSGCDIMGGALSDRDSTASEQAVPQIQSGVYGGRYVAGRLTLKISGQSAAGARGTVRVYIER